MHQPHMRQEASYVPGMRIALRDAQWRIDRVDVPSYVLKFKFELEDLWDDVIVRSESVSGKSLPGSFYKEEWVRIILPNRIDQRDDYLKVSRAGRGVALSRRQRAIIWSVFVDMRAELSNMVGRPIRMRCSMRAISSSLKATSTATAM